MQAEGRRNKREKKRKKEKEFGGLTGRGVTPSTGRCQGFAASLIVCGVQFDNRHCCLLSPSVKLEESDTKLKESSDKIEQLQSKLNLLFLLPKGPFRPLRSGRGGEL